MAERDAVIKDRDEKISTLERKLADSLSHADSLTSRLNEHELVIAGKDRRISELNALIGDRSRYVTCVCHDTNLVLGSTEPIRWQFWVVFL